MAKTLDSSSEFGGQGPGQAEDIHTILPLFCEIRFRDGQDSPPAATHIAVNPAALETSGRQVTATIRIGSQAAQSRWNPKAVSSVTQIAKAILDNYPDVKNVQIDYDCPQSKLADYQNLLIGLAKALGREHLSFTALPSWLNDPDAFQNLTSEVGYFVLQVHALDVPESPLRPPELIDPSKAIAAVQAADRIGAPFQVALPTYGSFAVFESESSRLLDVISEDLPSSWPEHTIARLGYADPSMIARLVRDWSRRPPVNMTGIVWYRLPVEGDLLNWPNATWSMVKQGIQPESRWLVNQHESKTGTLELSLQNDGQQPEPFLPVNIRLRPAHIVAAFDGINLYRAEQQGLDLRFHLAPSINDLIPLPPGKSLPIGWVRLKPNYQGRELIAEIIR